MKGKNWPILEVKSSNLAVKIMQKSKICLILSLLCILALVGCGKQGVTSSEAISESISSESSVVSEELSPEEIVEQSSLPDDKMYDVIESYYSIMNEVYEKNGEPNVVEVRKESDGSVHLDVVTGTGDDQVKNEDVMSWDNVQQAYGYLYSQNQVDLDGNILVDVEKLG